jgi:Tfp pilus assembly protein PilO
VTEAARKKLIVGAVFAVVVLAVLVGGYLMLVSPKKSKASSLQASIVDTQNKLTLALSVAHQQSGRAAVDESDLFRLSKAMPDRVDIAGTILDLAAIARSTGVSIDGLIPSDAVPTTTGTGYELVGIQATLSGGYANLTRFLQKVRRQVTISTGRIDAHGRLFGVDSIHIAPVVAGSSSLTATVKLETYVYSSSAGAPAPTTTTPAATSDLSATGANG